MGDAEPISQSKVECTVCSRTFNRISNLNRHLRRIHQLEPERNDVLPGEFGLYRYKCLEGCDISFKYNRELRQHLGDNHNIVIQELNLNFPNPEEFCKWLQTEELNNSVQYVHLTATKKRATGETFYYECNRTGEYHGIEEENRKRKPKKVGSVKLNRGCTSQIIVNKNRWGSYSVLYYKTHYGHDYNVSHLKLSKQNRVSIASKLLLGMPAASVLRSVQKYGGSKRMSLLQTKDIFNISRSFNIPGKEGKELNAMNITSYIEECSKQAYNPILYCHHDYLSTGEISIIIMTEYQARILSDLSSSTAAEKTAILLNINHLRNCDFELATLFEVSSSGGGCFPVAAMFTEAKNEPAYEQFFAKINEKIGVIRPHVFLTNCCEFYSKAWCKVNGAVPFCFYNSNQIDLDWQLNLNRISCTDADVSYEKRKWLYETLKTIQKCKEENDFMESAAETLKVMEKDSDFRDFLSYFLAHYADTKKWADCYRKSADIGIDYSEIEVSTELLHQYLNDDDEMRLNRIFQSFIQYIRDETINRMLEKPEIKTILIETIAKRHDSAGPRGFSLAHVEDECWNVTDEALGLMYVVRQLLKKPCCALSCATCTICVHCFICTCVDYFVSNTICEHIHHLWMKWFVDEESGSSGSEELGIELGEIEQVKDEEIIIEIDGPESDAEVEEVVIRPDIDGVAEIKRQIGEATDVLQANVLKLSNEKTLRLVLDAVGNLCKVTQQSSAVPSSDHSYL